MVDTDKITAKAGELADRAKKLGEQAAERASEFAQKARPVAVDMAHKAGPIAAHGVETTANKLDDVTHGKYSDRIKSVSSKIERVLDPEGYGGAQTEAGGTSQTTETPTAKPTGQSTDGGSTGSRPDA